MDKFILRGVLSGALGGLIAFVFARIFAEPQIQAAIDYEEGRGAAQATLDKAAGIAAGGHEHEIFSRAIQANLGIGIGMILLGAALGAVFAVVYAVCLGRVGKVRPRTLALLVAGGGFVGFYLVPFIKYPANPPAIGNEDTIGARTGLYLTMVVCSLLFLVLAVFLGRKLQARLGTWSASLVAGGAFIVAIGIVMQILPSTGELAANVAAYGHHATETPLPLTGPDGTIVYKGFPADVLANFRLYSVGAQLIMWTTIGIVFAPLAEKLVARYGSATKATV